MLQKSFHFEIKDLLVQFLAAFDNIVINRYNKNRAPSNELKVRYIYAPKQRVIFDLVNPAQNITLPVVSVTIRSISRDNERVFNKNVGFFAPGSPYERNPTYLTNYYRSPVPVNVVVDMSIIARYQTDMDQILSNFIPHNNPYIILSWTVPKEFNLPYTQEIRSEVLWDGNINLKYPTDINGNQKAQIVADTSFTIKGFLFPIEQDPVSNIFKVDVTTTAVSSRFDLVFGSYATLSGQTILPTSPLSSFANANAFAVSGRPTISNVDMSVDNQNGIIGQ